MTLGVSAGAGGWTGSPEEPPSNLNHSDSGIRSLERNKRHTLPPSLTAEKEEETPFQKPGITADSLCSQLWSLIFPSQ